MSAKSDLIQRLAYINSALQDQILTDRAPTEVIHNERAKMLRRGLGIIAFNTLEDFLKKRSNEYLLELISTGISFNNLTDKMQESSVTSALEALKSVIAREKRNNNLNWIQNAQNYIKPISSPLNNAYYEISEYSFMHKGSNVTPDDVNSFLSAMGISGGWTSITSLSRRLGHGALNLKQEYDNMADRRHNSAHEANYNYEYSWLQNVKSEIIAIAASFDILLKNKINKISSNNTAKIVCDEQLNTIPIIFAINSSGVFKIKNNITHNSRKNYSTLQNVLTFELPICQASGKYLVIHDFDAYSNSTKISDWHY